MKILKNIAWWILKKMTIAGCVQLYLKSAQREDGWFRSFDTKQSVDAAGHALPWCTYSFIKFIEPRLKKDFTVFEYGCGNSTLWYAQRVNLVISVEHNILWMNSISKKYIPHSIIVHREIPNKIYACSISEWNQTFDIIIIDGEDRNACVEESVKYLSQAGIIVFDNSQLLEYQSSLAHLKQIGFKEISFIGTLPIVPHNNTTTIFYRSDNCLGI